jgi:hypothetical protein
MRSLKSLFALTASAVVLMGCQPVRLVVPAPTRTAPQAKPTTLFTDVAAEAGVRFMHVGNAPFMPLGTGVAFGDYDNDDWLDIYVTHQAGANALYRNKGDGTFADVAQIAGVTAPETIGGGAIFADYDNDGWRDLYVVNQGPNILYRNNGDGTFADVTELAGVGDEGYGQSAAFGDYDNDGWLDLYVVNHIDLELRSIDKLYHNEGDGTFSDASDLLSEHLRSGAGFVASFFDYDDDGDLDLYVVNDFTFGEYRRNVLWMNDGPDSSGRWRFRDVSSRSRTNVAINGMGLAVGDFSNRGRHDLVMTNIGPNFLLASNGRGQYQEVGSAAGIRRARLPGDRETLTWCALSLDYDHDGWLDIFLCGSPLDKGAGLPSVLYRNKQDGAFADVTEQAGVGGEFWSRAGAYADFDRDGDVDFFVANYNQPAALYRNNSQDTRWLTVRLAGTKSNRDGLGAKVYLTAGGRTQFRQIQSGGSLGAGNDLAAYFGLGDAAQVERLEIVWPSGTIQILSDVPSNQILNVTESASTEQDFDLRVEALSLRDTAALAGTVACGRLAQPTLRVRNLGKQPLVSATLVYSVTSHDGQTVLEERIVIPQLVPFATQIITLPGWVPQAGVGYRIAVMGQASNDEYLDNNTVESNVTASNFSDIAFASRLVDEEPGSSVTTGDFDGDGLADLYLVNSARPNILYRNRGNGAFEDVTAKANVGYWGLSSNAITADFDGDGALDIYLLTLNENNVYYRNRGDGTFENATHKANLDNRGTSRAAVSGDFDQDGDVDIFLINDGQADVLFLNDGDGAFESAPKSAGLADYGGGRGAVAGDFNGDGKLDIYVVKDREPNVLYLNNGHGSFTVAPLQAGVADSNRSWGVVAADLDGDSDLDLYVTNLAQPNTLYLNNGNGTFVDGTTASGLGQQTGSSTSAMVADLNGDGTLDLAVANTGEQTNWLYLNDGRGRFRQTIDPSSVGAKSNSVALASADFNNDGGADLYVVNANMPDALYLNNHPNGAGCWR